MMHELKTWTEPFSAILDGRKRFEFRREDRGFAVGDILYLREWDEACPECRREADRFKPPAFPHVSHWSRGYTGRECRMRVTYIIIGPAFGVPEGFCVMSIEREAGSI